MRISFLLCSFFFYHFACSQSLQSGKQSAADYYFYPHFTIGKVIFKTGQLSEAALNYNMALEEMHFLTKKGDTLALSNEETFQFITVKNDTFYYDKGYLKIVERYNDIRLASKLKSQSIQKKQKGAYGEDISGTATVGLSHVTSSSYGTGKLNVNEGSYRNFEISYYIMGTNNTFTPVTNKSILKQFDKHRNKVDSYITSNALDLTKEADIKKLLTFATSLD